ncbi:MAG: bifunctional (p)ppGpp synthetase/guanosine-3',5'-bis(diphosphate) 3'-pyrophosphohydrolase [Saprospiraceae bacterium]|jgi:guanosine-3',5'-bis(diphosphate) 3'-pyrophosphohydrolase|nr:bifunctional (p)ppGpp synthetase/guanosine-3',5'-bis(diphosphate) 3'-pyrophosphohydrolase [Saprospiraceae bacterium]MCA0332528.1 RelA/SpoT family protein [Bacteroidota bacterium]MCB0603326.1 bifunctional (p)ppGpp synthetase/guanosine-3',5'-bis(diphosphate) 3'-pyrophosphohydrolase [Saprospiraceae bacterium]HQU95973.1 RelA/SpoT family protein [Saprospiraceae bacterium]HQW94798.1 RelA/SpoT family protein [Saprospiraceae bacterium]
MGTTPQPNDPEEVLLIQRSYRNLLKSIKSNLTKEDKEMIRQAYEIAVQAHSKQRRKSGEPYILHPIEVARICAEEIGLGPTAVVAALLHDVVEDTDVSLDDIKKQFGDKICRLVDGLTKLDSSYNSENPQAENFKKVLSTLNSDVRVVLIKMADRLHNMRTLGSMKREKQLKIASETSYIYAPLAHRLGLYKLKTEFMDLCLKILEPSFYQEIARKLQETKRSRNHYINEFIKGMNEQLDELNVPYKIIGRPKSISSIADKLKTKGVPFEEIYDLFAVRIIIDVEPKKEKSACWQVYSVITDVYTPVPERLKDWVTMPKSNGYESLHTTVIGPGGRFVEVQIRSERMDEIAEKGFAAHWKYKGVKQSTQNVFDTWLDSVRMLLEDKDKDALEFISEFKTSLYGEGIYVYTPKGDMVTLPKGATALDFAFNIHSDVGYHTISIKINNKLVPMSYVLENGDQIQVNTNKNQKPNENWLKMVITSKARTRIKQALKEANKIQADYGKEELFRKLSNSKLDFEENIDFLVKHFGFKNRFELFLAISLDQIKIDLKKFKIDGSKLSEFKEVQKVKTEEVSDELGNTYYTINPTKNKSLLLINGESADKFSFQFASCCHPLPGDDIFAFVTTANTLKIHRTSCPNSEHLLASYGYRVLKADWTNVATTAFVEELIIIGSDNGPGIIQSITENINKFGLNIKSFKIDGNEGIFEGTVKLEMQNLDQMNALIRTLKNLPYVSNVRRGN